MQKTFSVCLIPPPLLYPALSLALALALATPHPAICLSRFEQLIYDAQVHMMRSGTRAQAMTEVNEAIKLNPRSAVAWTTKARLLHAMEDDEEALEYAKKALTLSPNFLPALSIKADTLLFLKRYPEALTVSNQVLKVSREPNFVGTHANILNHMGKAEEAYKEISAVVKAHPEDFSALTLHADLAEKLGNWNQAIEDRSLLIKTSTSFSHMNHLQIRARAYMKVKKYDLAVTDLKAAIKEYPDLRELHAYLAEAYHALGKISLEMNERRKIQEIDSDLIP